MTTQHPVSGPARVEIGPLDDGHLPALARLVAAAYERLAADVPALPPGGLAADRIEPLIRRALAAGPSAMATEAGAVVGGIVGFPIAGLFGSGTAVLVPCWASAFSGTDRRRTFLALYASIASRWLELGWNVHCIQMPPGDGELAREFEWQGFGLRVVDAIRPLEATERRPPPGLLIEPASIADLDQLVPLAIEHKAFYAASPTFLLWSEDERPADQMERWLSTPGESVWVARTIEGIVSFIYLRPPAEDSCPALRDPHTIAIGGAFTIPEARGSGIAGALLERAAAWARNAGFQRMSVDFEAANFLARDFWLRTFQPVCLSYARHVDDRLMPGEVAP